MSDWFEIDGTILLAVLLSFISVYLTIVVLTRVAGLRSFSKMSAPDFAMTVAVGSLFASSISTASPSLPTAIFALACLFAGQWAFAWARERLDGFQRLTDNEPLLLMEGSTFCEANMREAQVTRQDLIGKLREANVLTADQIQAVVFETTGDISVLHRSGDGPDLEEWILDGVRR